MVGLPARGKTLISQKGTFEATYSTYEPRIPNQPYNTHQHPTRKKKKKKKQQQKRVGHADRKLARPNRYS